MTFSALMRLQGANRALAQQLADVTSNRDYWHDACLAAEKERTEIRQEVQALEMDLHNFAEEQAAIVEAAKTLAEKRGKYTSVRCYAKN